MIVPHNMHEQNGAGCIVAVLSQTDPDRLAPDRRMLDASGDHLLIKAKSITLQSDEGDFIAIGQPRSGGTAGITICTADGSAGGVWQTAVASMWVATDGDAKSLVQLTPSAAEFVQKDTGFVRLKDGKIAGLSSGPISFASPLFVAAPNPASAVPALVASSSGFAPSLTHFIGGLS